VYKDRTFTLLPAPPVAAMIKKILGLSVASGRPNTEKVGKLTKVQIEQIAKEKMPEYGTQTIWNR